MDSLRACTALDEEYAYGAAQMRLAEALGGDGRHEEAHAALEIPERNHGPTPESAYRRGRALKAMGDRDRARGAFAEVARLAGEVAGYQKRDAALWNLRARWSSFF